MFYAKEPEKKKEGSHTATQHSYITRLLMKTCLEVQFHQLQLISSLYTTLLYRHNICRPQNRVLFVGAWLLRADWKFDLAWMFARI